jgi:hypothetical protein
MCRIHNAYGHIFLRQRKCRGEADRSGTDDKHCYVFSHYQLRSLGH